MLQDAVSKLHPALPEDRVQDCKPRISFEIIGHDQGESEEQIKSCGRYDGSGNPAEDL